MKKNILITILLNKIPQPKPGYYRKKSDLFTLSPYNVKIQYMNRKKYTAIVFFNDNRRPHKYRNCQVKSMSDYAGILGAWYVNFYDPGTKEFIERVYIKKIPAKEQGEKT